MELQGRVALVTGAAHRVGKAIALALAQQGAHLIVHYGGSGDAARQTAEEIAVLGVDAITFQANLSNPDAIDALFNAVDRRFGRLDVLVNSAANFVKQPFDAITLDSWKDVMQVNLRAPFLCSQRATRLMRAASRPADQPALIVNISDLSGVHAWRSYVQHGVSKAGLIHLTRVTAFELAPDIRVNAVVPGAVIAPAGMDPNGDQWRRLGERVPLRRTGSPEFVGQTVVFLAQNDYITGAVIPVDGGEHLLGAVTHS